MFCPNCGKELSINSATCDNCGMNINSTQPVYENFSNGLIGFSEKINDPMFSAYKRKSVTWSYVFASILAVISIIGFPIYGNASGDIDFPNSLLYGIGIGAMFIVIAFLQTLRKSLDKTWDGVVADKRSYRERDQRDGGFDQTHTVYVLKIKKDSGGTKKHKFRDIRGASDYYNVGDRVRHHKGFYYYEKYDKSRDAQIMCAACMTFNDINNDICTRCKCPLLK